MIPDKEIALNELKIAGEMNPGPWTKHSLNVAKVAQLIAEACNNIDSNKAFVCGLLHDIGRKNGVSALKHTIDGYDYTMSKGWEEIARVCLTHSFPIKDIDLDIAQKDISKKQYDFISNYLENIEYDDYDKLIILCDSLADANGFCILEKRLVDTTRRYGTFPFTVDRWNKTYEYKEYFESIIGKSIYKLLPNIEKCIYSS